MSFWDVSALRTLLDSETDVNSPGSEELMSQVRENIEALFLLLLKESAGTATSDPPDDATGYFYDSAAGFEDDEHNGRTLLITSGTAKGNFYTIDDTVAASNRVECTGDNLYADGVRSGDSYIILYDLTSTIGHNHNGINSKNVILGDGWPLWMEGVVQSFTDTSYDDQFTALFKKRPGMNTLHLHARCYRENTGTLSVRLRVDTLYSTAATTTASSYTILDCNTVDISGLTDGTIYEIGVNAKISSGETSRIKGVCVLLE